jgi:hypothetical protein
MVRIAMLGCGLIGDFYAQALLGQRSRDQIQIAYSRSQERLDQFQRKWNIKNGTTDMLKAIEHPQVDAVVIATPNHLHEQAAIAAANAGKAILCTKPLGRNAQEAYRMLQAVEQAGVFHGYLEDLVYTPKTIKALSVVQDGSLGKILWVRSREALGSGIKNSLAVVRLWIWVATASKSPGTLLEKTFAPSKSSAGEQRKSIPSIAKTMRSGWCDTRMEPSGNSKLAGRSAVEWI